MGKGKGTFEYWACRAPIGKVIFEVGGGGIAEQVAKDGELPSFSIKDLKANLIYASLYSAPISSSQTPSPNGIHNSPTPP